jgi:DNA-binding MarR family transcriptional regulator
VTRQTSLAADFRDALRPLQRPLHAQRTLSPGKTGMLIHLVEQGPSTASELAVAERVSPQAVAMALHDLEELGFVERIPDEADRRRLRVVVTQAGRDGLLRERAVGTAWLERAFAERLDDEDRAILRAAIPVLRKLTETVDD